MDINGLYFDIPKNHLAILRIIFLLDKAGEEDLPRATAEGEVRRELQLMAYANPRTDLQLQWSLISKFDPQRINLLPETVT